MEVATIVKLAPAERTSGGTVSFEEAFGENEEYSQLRGRGRARRSARRQKRKMKRIERRRERKLAKQSMRQERKGIRQEERQRRKDIRKTRRLTRRELGREARYEEPYEEEYQEPYYEDQYAEEPYYEDEYAQEPYYEEQYQEPYYENRYAQEPYYEDEYDDQYYFNGPEEEDEYDDEYDDLEEEGYIDDDEEEDEYGPDQFDGDADASSFTSDAEGAVKEIDPRIKSLTEKIVFYKDKARGYLKRKNLLKGRYAQRAEKHRSKAKCPTLDKYRSEINKNDMSYQKYEEMVDDLKARLVKYKDHPNVSEGFKQAQIKLGSLKGKARDKDNEAKIKDTIVEKDLDPTFSPQRIDVPASRPIKVIDMEKVSSAEGEENKGLSNTQKAVLGVALVGLALVIAKRFKLY